MAALGLWVVLGLLRVLAHEMWRDELQAWMIARNSATPLELISNLRYEGHPGLWPLCLFLISWVTDSPVGMQVFNLAIGAASAWILLRWAPFSRWMTASLAFGYFVAYEYGTLSRSYSLGVLFLLAFCAVWAGAGRRRLALAALSLALLAMTSIYGVIVAAGLAAGVWWDTWTHQPHLVRNRRALWFAVIVALGISATVVFVRQPPDAGFRVTPRLTVDPNAGLHSLGAVWRGLAPVPPLQQEFWNRDILEPFPYVRAFVGLALSACVLFALRGHRPAFIAFAVGGGGLFAFSYIVYQGGVRHHGHFFLLFVASCWMIATSAKPDVGIGWRRLLGLLAVVQLAVGLFASMMDQRLKFSGSRDAAAFIRERYPPDIPIVVEPELPGVPLAAWLARDVFFAQSGRLGGFVIWNQQQQAPDFARSVKTADRLASSSGRAVLLVTTRRDVPPARFKHVGHFEGQIVREETYDVYAVEPAERGLR
jgi:hypothetical protein